MTTHTGFYLRPTLAELTAGWSSYGISPAKAVRELVQLHLARTNARGRGNKARRRMAALPIPIRLCGSPREDFFRTVFRPIIVPPDQQWPVIK